MTMDSTNPKATWIESIGAPSYAEVYEVTSHDADRVVIRFGVVAAGSDIYEVARLILPKDVAGAIGGSLLSSFGGKP